MPKSIIICFFLFSVNATATAITLLVLVVVVLVLFCRATTRSTSDVDRIESEYIKNLQQQVYFLELEANYLYPRCRPTCTVTLISTKLCSQAVSL